MPLTQRIYASRQGAINAWNKRYEENSVEEYIELLKRNILYGWVTCGSEAETYIDDTYEEFIKQKGEENA